jgi:hypothetical protein
MEGNEIRVFSLQIIVEDAKVQVHNLPDGKVSLEEGVRSERIREPGMGNGANGRYMSKGSRLRGEGTVPTWVWRTLIISQL